VCVSIFALIIGDKNHIFSAPRFIAPCVLSHSTLLHKVMSQTARFSENIINTKCVFRFFSTILPETFLVLRIIQLDITNFCRSPHNVSGFLVRF